ncbi:MAG: hypothetical protein N2D54_09855, partial [Chloroflexota bacterium]
MNSPNRPGQTIATALVVIGLLALALGGYLNTLTSIALSPFLTAQNWITVRVQTFQEIIASPEEITNLYQQNAQLEAEIANL